MPPRRQRPGPRAAAPPRPDPALVANLMHFARVLRAAGLPVGPGDTLSALDAVQAVGVRSRDDFYWALHSVFVNRRPQREVFDQAFHVFWRNPRILERMVGLLLPTVVTPQDEAQALSRRLSEALLPAEAEGREPRPRDQEVELDAALTWSDREQLRTMDFEQMSVEEMARAKAAVARLRLPLPRVTTRRFRVDPRGARIDMRATLRRSLRSGSSMVTLARKKRIEKPPPLVILCDISGSMSRYSRMLLHFAHTITGQRARVHSFVFGTRLTNISRQLREQDVDVALATVAASVQDWSGGTRIGRSLTAFNRDWSRRVCGQGAIVLLISDGLDRDAAEGLAAQMERLHKSCRRLLWLNPLLRYDRFEPKAAGVRAMLPHVDRFLPAHNLASLEDLVQALEGGQEKPRRSGVEAVSPSSGNVHFSSSRAADSSGRAAPEQGERTHQNG